jgi:aspartyl-tRNA synthetase
MIGGMERYYQIARCFRDEDLRADRQPEFTQIDMEMSFLSKMNSRARGSLARQIFKEIVGYEVKLPLRRIDFWEAMDTYGSDKPDTRYGLKLHDIADIMQKSSFEGFKGVPYIKAIVVPGYGREDQPQSPR